MIVELGQRKYKVNLEDLSSARGLESAQKTIGIVGMSEGYRDQLESALNSLSWNNLSHKVNNNRL